VSEINFGHLMDLTKLVKGQAASAYDVSADRFIVWSELSATMSTMLRLLANLSVENSFNTDQFINYLNSIVEPYLMEYYPDKDPAVEGSYLKKKARTAPYIVNMALSTQNPQFLEQSSNLIAPIKNNIPSHPIFNANSVFDAKFYEFSPDNRDATFQAAMLNNDDYVGELLKAIEEEVSYNGNLMTKPIDGRDIHTCVSSYGVWDDCLAQKYVKILSFASTYEIAAERLNQINLLDNRLAKQFALEISRHNWLRDRVSEEVQNDFQLGGIQLDGSLASDIVKATCANAWTVRDELFAREWANKKMSDSRWNGATLSDYCLTQIANNRRYLSQHYPSLRSWICAENNDPNCMDQLPEFDQY